MKLITKIITITFLFIGCQKFEPPTAAEDYINIQGRWISNEITLNLTQKKNIITGTAKKNEINYTVYGMSQSATRVFLHIRRTDTKCCVLIFAGNVIQDETPVGKLYGTIKENEHGEVKSIRFVRFR